MLFCNLSSLYLNQSKTVIQAGPCLSPDWKPIIVGRNISIVCNGGNGVWMRPRARSRAHGAVTPQHKLATCAHGWFMSQMSSVSSSKSQVPLCSHSHGLEDTKQKNGKGWNKEKSSEDEWAWVIPCVLVRSVAVCSLLSPCIRPSQEEPRA